MRLYTRDTNTWRLLGWEGQAVLALLFRRVDRAGVLDSGGVGPEEAICLATGVPIEVVNTAWPRMLKTGTIVVDGPRLVIPNFLEAQEARSSDAERQRKSRELARVTKRDAMQSQNVTNGHDLSHGVTRGHTVSQPVTPSLAVPSRTVPSLKKDLATGVATRPPAPDGKLVSVGPTAATWDAYSEAYQRKYGAVPTRNATVNGQLAAFVRRIGAGEAPQLAAFYLTHNGAVYNREGHSTAMLLKHAEKLHTEWVTGKKMTGTEAHQQDQTQANHDGWMETRDALVSKRT